MRFGGARGDGHHLTIHTATDVADGEVVVDGEHLLAGLSLRVQCRVEGVRMATDEKIAHGQAHIPAVTTIRTEARARRQYSRGNLG